MALISHASNIKNQPENVRDLLALIVTGLGSEVLASSFFFSFLLLILNFKVQKNPRERLGKFRILGQTLRFRCSRIDQESAFFSFLTPCPPSSRTLRDKTKQNK